MSVPPPPCFDTYSHVTSVEQMQRQPAGAVSRLNSAIYTWSAGHGRGRCPVAAHALPETVIRAGPAASRNRPTSYTFRPTCHAARRRARGTASAECSNNESADSSAARSHLAPAHASGALDRRNRCGAGRALLRVHDTDRENSRDHVVGTTQPIPAHGAGILRRPRERRAPATPEAA